MSPLKAGGINVQKHEWLIQVHYVAPPGLDPGRLPKPTAGVVGYGYAVAYADSKNYCAAILKAAISLAFLTSSLPPAIAG